MHINQNTVAVITGAASGIGRALAVQLAQAGAQLALADVNEAALQETAQLVPTKCTTHRVDVSDEARMQAFVAEVTAAHGRANLVINNAGVALYGTVEQLSTTDIAWLMGVNFWGVVYGTKYFLPVLQQQPAAHLVNISSIFGIVGFPGQSAYNASKFAVRGFTEALRHELTGSHVRVSCVHPGGITGGEELWSPSREFDVGDSTHYSSDNFAWAVLGGVTAPDSANRILLGQFTTDGVFSFCLNIWIKIPDSLVCNDPNCHTILEFYGNLLASDTAGTGYAGDNKFTLPGLCFDSSQQPSDCAGVPGGSALPGTGCDDGNADTQNDVYSNDCVCVGEDCLGVLGGNALPGQPCDDNDPGTTNDTWLTGCLCQGSVGMVEQQQGRVHVFPNPAHDLLRVDLEGMNGGPVSIAITSVTQPAIRRQP